MRCTILNPHISSRPLEDIVGDALLLGDLGGRAGGAEGGDHIVAVTVASEVEYVFEGLAAGASRGRR